MAQLSKLTSSRTQEQFEKQQVSSIENKYSRFFGPRVPLFRMFAKNSGTVIKTVSRSEQEFWTFRAKFKARLLELHSTWTDEYFDDDKISQTNLNVSFFWHFERQFSGILWKRHPEEHLEWNFFLKVLNLFFSSSDLHRKMFWLLETSFLHCYKTAFTFPKHHFHNSCQQDPTSSSIFFEIWEKTYQILTWVFTRGCWNLFLGVPRINMIRNIFLEGT